MPLRPRPVVKDDKDIRVIDNGIIRIDTVYVPLPEPLPRPRPIVRHEEEKKDRRNERQEQNRRKGKPSELAFEYFGTPGRVRSLDRDALVHCNDTGLPGEQALSMRIDAVQKLALKPSAERIVRIDYLNAKGETVKTRVNENIVAFYDTYPKVSGALDQSPWQVIAEMPTDTYLTEQLYPQLRKLIKGMSQEDAVNTLMGVCQSFSYGYDDEVWGYDYPLTVEQSWYHPKSDCEDHAIHLSRLVRDLLGLEKRYFSCETID